MINLCNMLTLRYDPGQEITNSIKKITIEDTRLRKPPFPSTSDVERKLREVIRMSIEHYKPKSVSMALSSGVDSNVVLSLIRDEFSELNINCITVTFDESTESYSAKNIAEKNSSEFCELVIEDPLRELPYIINIVKEPRWNIYQYYFIREASQSSGMLFTGDGGDELFGGYTFRYKKFLQFYREDLGWEDMVRTYLDCHDRDWVPDQPEMFGPALHFQWKDIYSLLKLFFNNDLDPLDKVFLADYHGKLMYDFVPTNMKLFDHFKLTGIAPLLDKSLIDISINMPYTDKFDPKSNMGKIPLRKIVARYGDNDITKNKIGFGLDLKTYWTRAAKGIVTSNLDNGRIFEDKIINRDFYNRALKRIADTQDVRYISKMLQLLSLEIWYRIFVTFEMKATSVL